jgi:hypothetical protein
LARGWVRPWKKKERTLGALRARKKEKKQLGNITSSVQVIFKKLVLRASEKYGVGGDFRMN